MNRTVRYIANASLTLAAIGLLMSAAISLRSQGMAEGLKIGKQDLESFKDTIGYIEGIKFSGGKGTYEGFRDDYRSISFFLGIMIAGLLLLRIGDGRTRNEYKVHWWGFLLVAVSVVLALSTLKQLIRDKTSVEPDFWNAPINAFAAATIVYDWILFALILAIVILQIASVALIPRDRSEATRSQL